MIQWLLIGNILLTSYNEFYDSRKILNFSEAFAPLQKKSEEKIFVRTKYLKSVVNIPKQVRLQKNIYLFNRFPRSGPTKWKHQEVSLPFNEVERTKWWSG